VLAPCSAPAQVRDVVVNEIAWMGTLTSSSDEWIELVNNTGSDIDLGGWTLIAVDGTPSIALSGTIPAGGYFLLERTDDSTVPGVAADQIYTGALENGGEDLSLRDAGAVLQDRVDAWHAGVSTPRETMDRVDPLQAGTIPANWVDGPVEGTPMSSGGGGTTCTPPTRTVDCQLGAPFAFRNGGPVVINELMINPSAVADSAGEYVELYNAGSAAVDIEGWTLRDDGSDSFTIATGGPVVLAPGDTFVLATEVDSGLNGGFAADLDWGPGFFLSNSGDELVLEDELSVEQDRIDYTDAPFTSSAGGSLERVSPRLPTGDPLSWADASAAFGLGDLGTPGAVNTLQARRYLLGGTLVTMDETLPLAQRVFDGTLYVQGNRIMDVLATGAPLPPDAAGAMSVATAALVFPGLMNIHDHITFNPLPAWDVPQLMQDVSDWTSLDDYRRHVRYPQDILIDGDYYDLLPEVGKYAELKALAAGTTAVQGSSPLSSGYTRHLARNVDLGGFGPDKLRQRALSILDSTFQTVAAPNLVADMEAGLVDAWLSHLGEGTAGDALLEFDVLADICLLRSETVIIHGTALTASDLDDVAAAGAKLVIAPTSNYLYYGATADVPGAVGRGIDVSLSTDWSPAGDKNLLSALKNLALVNDTVWSGALSDLEMVEMVTTAPAKTLNWCERVGSLRAGMFADLAVIAGNALAPYSALIEAVEEDVLLTVVDGDPRYGSPGLMATLKPGDHEIASSACGFQAALDITEPAVPRGDQLFSEISALLGAASALDFQHMKANFQDPAVAAMTDPEFQTYLDTNFPLGLVPKSLDPLWVIDDADYFDGLRNETNVTALDPNATLDSELYWDDDGDGLLDSCETPCAAGPDGDGDGLSDCLETSVYGTNPLLPDSDGDGLSDGAEVDVYATSPLDADSDEDGFSDGVEVAFGSDPNNGGSTPELLVPTMPLAGIFALGGALLLLGGRAIRRRAGPR
jgi:hypothetical protein